MILLAILFPSISFLIRGKILTAILCFVLQITIIGWIPAAIWAVASLIDSRNKSRIKDLRR